MIRVSFVGVVLGMLGTLLWAQSEPSGSRPAPHPIQSRMAIPEALKPSLQARLALFTEVQAQGRWDEVPPMLGRYFRGSRDLGLSPVQKACLVSQMQAFQVLSFEMKTISASTELMSIPLSRRWWMLMGEALMKTESGERKQQIEIVAYRDNGEWYFTPPNYDDYWESTHITQSDLARDHRSEVTAQNNPNCPLEIVDLHAFLNREYRSSLDIKFKLKNRTQKSVVEYGYRIFAKGLKGEQLGRHPTAIEPGGSVRAELDTSRYVFFCQGPEKNNLVIDSVVFGDGSTWELAGQPASKQESRQR